MNAFIVLSENELERLIESVRRNRKRDEGNATVVYNAPITMTNNGQLQIGTYNFSLDSEEWTQTRKDEVRAMHL